MSDLDWLVEWIKSSTSGSWDAFVAGAKDNEFDVQ